MGITKKINLSSILIFVFLVLFPFGQIIRIGVVQPVDLVVGIGALYAIFAKLKRPDVFKYFERFLLISGFSWVFGLAYFRQIEVLYGLLYLARLAAYLYFFIVIWNYIQQKRSNSAFIVNSLISLSLVSAVFGWIQFLFYPSLKAFMVWGWDEHYLRLVGTFLDPAFLGLIIVFGLLTTIIRIMAVKKKIFYIFTAIFLAVSLAFTYSRASYLAFFAGLLVVFYYKKMLKKAVLIILTFILLMLVLPTEKNHVLSFTRGFSALARIENYQSTLDIFKKSPVFGVGYNNLCLAYNKFVGYQPYSSHACSGSDSSILTILSSMGLVGFVAIFEMLKGIKNNLQNKSQNILLFSSFAVLLIHSLFSNSLFYPWVMGWMLFLLAISLRGKVEG